MREPNSAISSIRVAIFMSDTALSMIVSRCWRCWCSPRAIVIKLPSFIRQASGPARIFAANAPFDLKDQLKERGYRWEDADPPVQRLTAFERFRGRK